MLKTKKTYILLIALLCCSTAFAQDIGNNAETDEKAQPVKRVRPDRKPRKQYIVSSGDTTVIVGRVNTGLRSKDSEFLLKDERFINDDLYTRTNNSRYQSLEEATYDVNRLLDIIETGTKEDNQVNKSLGYLASRTERMKKLKEEQVMRIQASKRDSLFSKMSATDLAELREKFGNTPTYYINGIETTYDFIEVLFPEEILAKKIKVENTLSGNPNGEILYTVPNYTVYEIGLLNQPMNDSNQAQKKGVRKEQIKTIKVNKKKEKTK